MVNIETTADSSTATTRPAETSKRSPRRAPSWRLPQSGEQAQRGPVQCNSLGKTYNTYIHIHALCVYPYMYIHIYIYVYIYSFPIEAYKITDIQC